MFLSAFVPMYILVLIRILLDVCMGNTRVDAVVIVVICTLSIGIVVGICGMWGIFRLKTTSVKVSVDSVDNVTGQYFFGYFSLFVLLAVNYDLTMICEMVVFLIVNVMIGVVYTHNNLFFINPLLNLMGYDICNICYTHSGKQVCIKVFTNRKITKGDTIYLRTMFNDSFCILR